MRFSRTSGRPAVPGGRGGDVLAVGVSDMSALNQFRFKKQFKGEDRLRTAAGNSATDATAKRALLKLPVGTVIHNLTTGADSAVEKNRRADAYREEQFGRSAVIFISVRRATFHPAVFNPAFPAKVLNSGWSLSS